MLFRPTATSLIWPPIATTANLSPSQHSQKSSASVGVSSKVIIGLTIAIVVPVLLVTIGLAYFCIRRKDRRRKDEDVIANQDLTKTDDEGEYAQLYLQQKVELDDEQRRHEMEAVDISYEMEVEDEMHEMPVKKDRNSSREELRRKEHSKELEDEL